MKTVLRWFIVVSLILAVGAGLFAAGGKEGGAAAPAQAGAKTYKIGFNNYSDSHEFCYKVHEGIKEYAQKYGMELLYAEAMMDASRVTGNLENFAMQGVDAIFEFNWIPEVTANFVSKYPNIKVVSGDVRTPGAYYFGANNIEAGKVLGRYLAERVKKDWNGTVNAFVIAYYQAGGEELNKRMGGIVEGFKETFPNFPDNKVFWFDNTGDALKARNIVSDFLSGNPKMSNIVVATNNDEGGLGALSAVETAGRQKDVFIVSHGADTPFQENIHAGKGNVWVGSVAYTPEKYGEFLIPWLKDILDGKSVPSDMNPKHFVVTAQNINQYYPKK